MNGEKTMVFIYYSGHACVDADLQLLLTKASNQFFPIQKLNNIVATLRDVYAVSLFDCTRKRIDLSKFPSTQSYTSLSSEMMARFESQNFFKNKLKLITKM